MSLMVETGTGLSNADSYISLADASTYVTAHSQLAAWTDAEDSEKEAALRLATQYLDINYAGRWFGSKANSTQSLAWPRIYAEDEDGYTIASNVVPQKIKDACVEAALRVIAGDSLLAPLENPGAVKMESVKVGPISTTTEYAGSNSPVTSYPIIDGLLRGLMHALGRIWRG